MVFNNYSELKIGFTTQNFNLAMPNSVSNLKEIIEYASKEGFHFIQLRDDFASLTNEDCIEIAGAARKNNIQVFYEIQKNPLDTGYFRAFNNALRNLSHFSEPRFLRVMVSNSEFVNDLNKKGWNEIEFSQLTRILDSCSLIADETNIRLIIENSNEAIFGEKDSYFGLNDLFANTEHVGFQFDIGNPFRKASRDKADPDKVEQFLATLGHRWVSAHLKTILDFGGEMQVSLTENPLSIERVIELMGRQNVKYVSIEQKALPDKEECLRNHKTSIRFLRDLGVLQ